MKKNKIVFVIIAILFAIASVIGYFVYNDLKEEEKLNNEIKKIMEVNLLTEKIDMQIKTTGEYAKVEKNIKEYINEYSLLAKSITNKMQATDYKNVLTPAYIQKDMPNFTNSAKVINELNQITDEINLLIIMTNEDEIIKKMNKKQVDYYQKLYKKIMLSDNMKTKLSQVSNQVSISKNSLKALTVKYTNAINFLKSNKGKWEVNNNQLYFYDNALATKYNQIIA